MTRTTRTGRAVGMEEAAGEAGEVDSALGCEIAKRARALAERIVDRHAAEDIAQDVVLTCLERMQAGTWRLGPGGVDGYVRCVVRRRAVDALRRRQRRQDRDAEHARELVEGVHAWMDPELALEARELDELHASATARLSAPCRRAYHLVREQRVSYAVAAAVLSVTPSAVNVSVVRAQRTIRAELEGRGIAAPKGRGKGSRRGSHAHSGNRSNRTPASPTNQR